MVTLTSKRHRQNWALLLEEVPIVEIVKLRHRNHGSRYRRYLCQSTGYPNQLSDALGLHASLISMPVDFVPANSRTAYLTERLATKWWRIKGLL